MSGVYTNQAIFDAIVAATHIECGSIIISTPKFVEAFNNHRDRGLCGSLALPPPQVDSGREAVIEECANIALAIDSGRGNEKEIAKAIRRLAHNGTRKET